MIIRKRKLPFLLSFLITMTILLISLISVNFVLLLLIIFKKLSSVIPFILAVISFNALGVDQCIIEQCSWCHCKVNAALSFKNHDGLKILSFPHHDDIMSAFLRKEVTNKYLSGIKRMKVTGMDDIMSIKEKWYYVKISDNLNYRICNKRCFILVSLC